jgi:hypothetical protein
VVCKAWNPHQSKLTGPLEEWLRKEVEIVKRRVLRGRSLIAVLVRNGGNLNQEEVARGAMVDRSVISRAENGAAISDYLFAHIVDACGGIRILNNLIDELRSARDWLISRKHSDHLLYA